MKFVQFGKEYINMDQVVHIEYYKPNNPYDYYGANIAYHQQEGYKLYTNRMVDGLADYIWIEGSDMIALEMWLKEHSDDAREPFMSEE
jgi:hypothetical protein